MASHVSQCMAKACMCDTWQGEENIVGPLDTIYGAFIHGVSRSVRGSSKEKRKGGKEKEEERRREREERKGERKEEKRRRKGRKRGKRKRKRKECCVVSRPGRKKTRNCDTRGRFPPTQVILRLEAV